MARGEGAHLAHRLLPVGVAGGLIGRFAVAVLDEQLGDPVLVHIAQRIFLAAVTIGQPPLHVLVLLRRGGDVHPVFQLPLLLPQLRQKGGVGLLPGSILPRRHIGLLDLEGDGRKDWRRGRAWSGQNSLLDGRIFFRGGGGSFPRRGVGTGAQAQNEKACRKQAEAMALHKLHFLFSYCGMEREKNRYRPVPVWIHSVTGKGGTALAVPPFLISALSW